MDRIKNRCATGILWLLLVGSLFSPPSFANDDAIIRLRQDIERPFFTIYRDVVRAVVDDPHLVITPQDALLFARAYAFAIDVGTVAHSSDSMLDSFNESMQTWFDYAERFATVADWHGLAEFGYEISVNRPHILVDSGEINRWQKKSLEICWAYLTGSSEINELPRAPTPDLWVILDAIEPGDEVPRFYIEVLKMFFELTYFALGEEAAKKYDVVQYLEQKWMRPS